MDIPASPGLSSHAFFPKAESILGWADNKRSNLPDRPTEVGPVFDEKSNSEPIDVFNSDIWARSYVPTDPDDVVSVVPEKPADFNDEYLYPMLTKNERLRLTMLWYHTYGLDQDKELLHRLQDKIELVQQFIGWEFAICGVVDNATFTRLATAGLPLAILPRRESTCSHTITQRSGSVFAVPHMSEDWRFQRSPPVDQGGLRSYAGTQLRCRIEDDEEIALGSLCVASNTEGLTLTRPQRDTLVRFAGIMTEEILNRTRTNRRSMQQRMNELIAKASSQPNTDKTEAVVMDILREIYPRATTRILNVRDNSVQVDGDTVVSLSRVRYGLWEDSAAIDAFIRTGNHGSLEFKATIRAIVGKFWAQPLAKVLIVASQDIHLVFDDIDAWFVERCSAILHNVAQERSLQEALEAKERFLRGITHQLRTPIHGVLGSVDLLAEELALRSQISTTVKTIPDGSSSTLDAAEVLRTIRNSGRELMSTVNNMIKLNRWAEISASPRAATLNELARLEQEILDDAVQMIPEEEITKVSIFFDNRLTKEASNVVIDMTLLKECLQSLVLNALQNTVQGSIDITISNSTDYSSLIFDVEDSGAGIDLKDHERIFDAYEKTNIHTRGAGLGLTLACRLAGAMNGSVTLISSEPEKGSHFRAEFRDPGFACSISKPPPVTLVYPNLAKTFYIVPSDPPAPMARHFASFLTARGFEEVDSGGDNIFTIITFTPKAEQFERLLDEASHDGLAVSLVPAGEKSEELESRHQNVLFYSGPFTTLRLEQILDQTNDAHAKLSSANNSPLMSHSDSFHSNPNAVRNHRRKGTSMATFKRTRSSQQPRCLLVDDNLINLRIIRMWCEKRSLRYRTAIDGFQAIDQYKEAVADAPINLVLLDLQMPNCGGIQACKEIRAFEKERGLTPAVVFIVTGQDSSSDREQSFAAGANEFFVKPMSLKTLDRGIGQYFEGFV